MFDTRFIAWSDKGFSVFLGAHATQNCLACSHAARLAKKTTLCFALNKRHATVWLLTFTFPQEQSFILALSGGGAVVGKTVLSRHIFHIWTLVLSFKPFYSWWHCLHQDRKTELGNKINSWLPNCGKMNACKHFPWETQGASTTWKMLHKGRQLKLETSLMDLLEEELF